MSKVVRLPFSYNPQFAIAMVLATIAASCGGSSPLTPGAPSAVVPVAAPAPAGDSPFPNLLGTWSGTLTINGTAFGASSSDRCETTWLITSQTEGSFSGTFQTSGATTGCGQAGTVGGNMNTGGGVTGLSFGVQVGVIGGCTRQTGTPYSGLLSGGTLSAISSERLTCTVGGTTTTADRNAVFSVTRR